MEKIYFDNAATTALYPSVIEKMLPYIQFHFGNPSSIHALGRKTRVAIEQARKKIADILGTTPANIFFTSSATESINTAIQGAIYSWKIKHFITSSIEHHAVLETLKFYKNILPIDVDYLPITYNGNIDISLLQEKLVRATQPTCVILTHVNNELGNIIDIAYAGKLCKQYNAKFICDMVQSIGTYNIPFSTLPIDIIAISGHKIHGPKGIGILYSNNIQKIAPLLHGGNQERNMRAGTENVATIIGLAEALELSYNNIAKKYTYLSTLRNQFINELKINFTDVIFNTDLNHSSPKILNIGFPINAKTEMLLYHLDLENICVSNGSACSSGANIGSHVIAQISHHKQIPLRFSFCEHNTLEEIFYTIKILKKILA